MGARAGEKVTDKGKGASLPSELDAEHLQPHRSTACRTDDQKQPMDLELNNDQDDASLESKAQCALVASCSTTKVTPSATRALVRQMLPRNFQRFYTAISKKAMQSRSMPPKTKQQQQPVRKVHHATSRGRCESLDRTLNQARASLPRDLREKYKLSKGIQRSDGACVLWYCGDSPTDHGTGDRQRYTGRNPE